MLQDILSGWGLHIILLGRLVGDFFFLLRWRSYVLRVQIRGWGVIAIEIELYLDVLDFDKYLRLFGHFIFNEYVHKGLFFKIAFYD